jgi:VWFA-related protein
MLGTRIKGGKSPMRTVTFCAPIFTALLTAAHGQDVPPPIVRVSVDRIQIGAVVTDAKGAHVTNLGARDFTILDGGKSQQLTNCEYIRLVDPKTMVSPETTAVTSAPAAPSGRGLTSIPAAAQPLSREQTQRSMVFLVDDLSFQPATIPAVRAALVKAIQQNLRPTDMAALIRSSSGNSSLEQLTSDRRILLESVTRISWRPEGNLNPGILHLAGPLANGSRVHGSTRTVQVIQYVISAMRDLPGRKAIFLISQSLPVGGGYTGPRSDMATMLGVLVDRALRSGVVIYSVDPTPLSPLTVDASYDETGDILAMQGSRAGPMPRATSSEIAAELQRQVQGYTVRELALLEFSRAGMRLLSEGTGGQMAADTDVANALGRFAGDLEGYYLLTYRPSAAERYFGVKHKETPFRSVKVRMSEPGLLVRSYAGYVPVEDAAEPDPSAHAVSLGLGSEVAKALFSPFPESGVHVDLTASFIAPQTISPQLRLLVNIDAHDIAFTAGQDGRHDARIDLVARAGSEWNEPGEVVSKQIVLRLKDESFAEAMRVGLIYPVTIVAQHPGLYDVRVAVRDTPTGKLGSARGFVEVPDLMNGRLAVSGVLLHNGADELHRFHQQDSLSYMCRAFHAKSLKGEVRIVRDGKQVLAVPAIVVANDDGSVTLEGVLPLAALAPGAYSLQVVAIEDGSTESGSSQWADFEIVN